MSCSLCVHFREKDPSMLLPFPLPFDLPSLPTRTVFLPLILRLDSSSLCSLTMHVRNPGSRGMTHPLTQHWDPWSACLWQNSSVTRLRGSLQSWMLQQGCPKVTPSVTAADSVSDRLVGVGGMKDGGSAHKTFLFQPLRRL